MPDELPEGSETITASLIAKAVMEGEDFEPKNEAQRQLKKDIANLPEGEIYEIPNDYD